MIPYFEIFNGWIIYTFGLTLTICFFLFLWILKKSSTKFGINFSFFLNRIFLFFISTFVFSRIFYIISRWEEFKFIQNWTEFFVMSDYNFSLMGALFGFLLVLYICTRSFKIQSGKYIDAVILSFLFVAIFGYIGAFLGGQVYGEPTKLGIGVIYSHPFSPVENGIPIFPLGLFYSGACFLIFTILYILADFVKIRGLLGYIGLILFSSIVLILENFNGQADLFVQKFDITFSQICAVAIIGISFYKLYKIMKNNNGKELDIIV